MTQSRPLNRGMCDARSARRRRLNR